MRKIHVKYLFSRSNKVSRLKVSSEGVKSIIFPYGFFNNPQMEEIKVARLFCVKNQWPTDLKGGQLPCGNHEFSLN